MFLKARFESYQENVIVKVLELREVVTGKVLEARVNIGGPHSNFTDNALEPFGVKVPIPHFPRGIG